MPLMNGPVAGHDGVMEQQTIDSDFRISGTRPWDGLLVRWYGSPAVRRRLAGDWERMLGRAASPSSVWRVPVARQRVLLASPDIRRLVGVLCGQQRLSPRGVAMAHQLLTDGTGPLYAVGPARDLANAVRAVLRELEPPAAALAR